MALLTALPPVGNPAQDTALLNAALAALQPGDTLALPPGEWGIRADLLLRTPHVRLRGAGVGATTIWIAENWTAAAVPGTAPAMLQLLAEGWTQQNHVPIVDLEISGISFVGIQQAASPSDPKAIVGADASNVRIRDCSFAQFSHETIWPSGPTCERWRIENNDFAHCGHFGGLAGAASCITSNGRDAQIRGNHFLDCYYPIGVAHGPALVVGNIIRDHLGAGISVGEFDAADVVVAENVIAGVVGLVGLPSGIKLGTVSSNVNVHGNVIRLGMVPGGGQAVGILASGSGGVKDGQMVSGNLIRLDMAGIPQTMTGIAVQGDGAVVTVRGNDVVFFNVAAAYHAAFAATAKSGETLRTVFQMNRSIGALVPSGWAYDLTRTGSGVHVMVATANVGDGGYHRYDGNLYGTGLDNRPVSFGAAGGLVAV